MPIACRDMPNIIPFDANCGRFFVNLHALVCRSACQTARIVQRLNNASACVKQCPVIHVTANMVRRGLRVQQCYRRTTALPLFFACAQIRNCLTRVRKMQGSTSMRITLYFISFYQFKNTIRTRSQIINKAFTTRIPQRLFDLIWRQP